MAEPPSLPRIGRSPELVDTLLPIMPATASELRRLLPLSTTLTPSLQRVMRHDPAVTIALFRLLESLRPGASDQVADIAHAASLIGMQRLGDMLTSLEQLRPVVHGPGTQAHAARAYSQAAHAACYARALAQTTGLENGPTLGIAALLQNPATIALWQAEPEAAQRATFAWRDGVCPDYAFGAELGRPIASVNRQLADVWGFPRLARQALARDPDGSRPLEVVRLAVELAAQTAAGWQHDCGREALYERLAGFLRTDTGEALRWLQGAAVTAARELTPFDYPLAAFELLLLPGEQVDDSDAPEMYSYRPDEERQLLRGDDLNRQMSRIMRQIRRQTHASRVVFAMLDRQRTQLRTRLTLGEDGSDCGLRMDLPLEGDNLFVLLMRKPQSAWINGANREKYRRYLDPALYADLGESSCCVMSIFIDGKPLGLMYADGRSLTPDAYARFRTLCDAIADTLLSSRRRENIA
jgi:HD-like signal output (HDOD) protein